MAQALAFINPRLSTQNVGDLFIEDSVKRILAYDPERSVEVDPRQPISDADIERINSTEAAVIVGTNLWYRQLRKPGRWQFSLEQLRQIRVPIVPLGLGTTRHAGEDNGFDDDALAQLRHIHASCRLASVRDQRTLEALNEAGIRNVAMTGCPTLFRSLNPQWQLRRPATTGKIVLTVRRGQRHHVHGLAALLRARGLQPIIAAQQEPDTRLWSWRPWPQRRDPLLYRFDMTPYRQLVDEASGAIGWRLHGNMLHLAHGNPAVFFANCSRAQSFCDSFDLPCTFCPDHTPLAPAQLSEAVERYFDPATFARFPQRYAEHRAEMARFLDANGLAHRLQPAAAERAA